MFLPRLDREAREPLARQLADRILEGIESGALAAGDALPSTRRMADWVGVSRFTVERAYDELWAQGYVEARSGSYTRVRSRPPRRARAGASEARPSEPAGRSRPSRSPVGSAVLPEETGPLVAATAHPEPPEPASLRPADRIGPAAAAAIAQRERMRSASRAPAAGSTPVRPERAVIDFFSFQPDRRLFPSEAFKRAAAEALRSDPASALTYGSPAGHPALRERIAKRMREHGIDAGPDNVLVTEGALHAVDLVSRLLAGPGRSALCEDPTYPGPWPPSRPPGSGPFRCRTTRRGWIPPPCARSWPGRTGTRPSST